ncbi:Kelch repeat-containing protein, partial [Streptomyces mirabilis]|uniref:Kelch repeat-containing protein n=1 Tax=Streptomyces mirabilis TaxID=68239 RepID=UPI00367A59B1
MVVGKLLLYVVGGCGTQSCGSTDVTAYDPADDSWSTVADYPEQISWSSCGGISGKLYCAGGLSGNSEVKHSYVYDPAANAWSQVADLPIILWGSAYTSANGLLVTAGGVTQNSITNQGFAFDPQAGTWTALPNADTAAYRGGGALGFFKVGGGVALATPAATVEVLPGYDQGETGDVSWLSESEQQLTLQPGKSAKVTITLDASVAEVTQPGDFTAQLSVSSDTPYPVPSLPVEMDVAPPKTWGKITGTVLGGHRERRHRADRRGHRPDRHLGHELHADDGHPRRVRTVARRPQQSPHRHRRQGRLPADRRDRVDQEEVHRRQELHPEEKVALPKAGVGRSRTEPA